MVALAVRSYHGLINLFAFYYCICNQDLVSSMVNYIIHSNAKHFVSFLAKHAYALLSSWNSMKIDENQLKFITIDLT